MNKSKGLLVVLVAVLVVLACTVPFKDRVQAVDEVVSYNMMNDEGQVYAVTSDEELARTAYNYERQ